MVSYNPFFILYCMLGLGLVCTIKRECEFVWNPKANGWIRKKIQAMRGQKSSLSIKRLVWNKANYTLITPQLSSEDIIQSVVTRSSILDHVNLFGAISLNCRCYWPHLQRRTMLTECYPTQYTPRLINFASMIIQTTFAYSNRLKP